MSNDTMTNAWFHRLKAANRQLIKLNGGIELSAEITSLSKSQIGRCHSDSDTELLPLPAVMRLEAECGNYAVTRAQAELHGCKLADPREQKTDGVTVMRGAAELGGRVAQYQHNHFNAAMDLKLTRSELSQGMRDLQSVVETASSLMNAYASALANGGEDAPALRLVGEE
ncbi:hypothetical protein ASC97_04150 [Rhizobium sp. Root1203]|uniref:hypothetical protein n=1 Tax=Rhizobium sp. Root1203 TaxID=1736427 RepID=UPI000710C552|nr:hypothetical protein [Rhizobium sp. Root1203]KQV27578.1 hypothetical protein ASC97_04150 [Rhizobium sp. Root1203]